MNKSPGRGRRTGTPDTRETIRQAARDLFMADGYQAVSLRAVAAAAGVDVALISYYFGSKQGLFGAAMALPINPAEVVARAIETAPDVESLAGLLVRNLVTVWDDPVTGPQLRAIAATAVADENLARLLREGIAREIVTRLATRIGGRDAQRRAGLFVTQLVGLIFTRYVIGVEPIASMPAEQVITGYAVPLRATLTSR